MSVTKNSRPNKRLRIAIVGGGPAGLSLARLLRDVPSVKATVFERSERVGGKSLTLLQGNSLIELGTCYTTASHHRVLGWMKENYITMSRLGEQIFDGDDVIRYIKAGPGPSLMVQVISYVRHRKKSLLAAEHPGARQADLEDVAQSTADWLAERNLGKMYRLMQRAVTALGYGRLEQTPALHALRWVDFELIWSGVRKHLQMPVEGWSEFWRRLAADLEVRTQAPVARIERTDGRVRLELADGEVHDCDVVVCSIPVDEFLSLCNDVSDLEAQVRNSIRWGQYTTTLLPVQNWFEDHPVEGWSDAIVWDSKDGMLISARREAEEPELGGRLYVTGQYRGQYSGPELLEILYREIERRGARPGQAIMQANWKYMAFYDPDAIRSGLLNDMRAIQGQNSTYFTGTAWSHEAVSNIVKFNERLARTLATLAAQSTGVR